ncbi:MAG TPA: YjgN family protein [Gemmatimonadales bacterium]
MPEPTRKPEFHGEGGTLFGIYLVNALLTIVTIGFYSFWGKTRLRTYLYGQTEFDGDRFAYHGTGMELLRGWLKAVGLLLVAGLAAGLLVALVNEVVGVLVLYAALALVLFPMALVGARAYRLSRTSWRGIRFSFRGDWPDLLPIYVPGILLTAVTLGIYYPLFHVNVRRFLVNESHFGSQAFAFDGQGRDLLGRHVLAMLLTPLTLGFYWFWYAAYRQRYYWAHTSIAGGQFSSSMTGAQLMELVLTNVLLLIVTLGLAFPWVRARTIRFHCNCLSLEGPEDFAAIRQAAVPASATGEGLTEIMDVDLVGADFFGL